MKTEDSEEIMESYCNYFRATGMSELEIMKIRDRFSAITDNCVCDYCNEKIHDNQDVLTDVYERASLCSKTCHDKWVIENYGYDEES